METPTNPNYEGKFVFIEQTDPKSSYGNGEYFCVRQTPGTLYVTKLVGGYGGHTFEAKAIIGTSAWRVVEAWDDDCAAMKGAQEMIEWGDLAKDSSYKKQWVEYVYTDCARNGQQILRTLQKKRGACVEVCKQSDVIEVCVPKGVTKINLKFAQ